jgi:hypothetical protein
VSIVVGGCVKRLVSYFISSVFDLGRCEYSCPGLIMRCAWLLSGEGLGLKFGGRGGPESIGPRLSYFATKSDLGS